MAALIANINRDSKKKPNPFTIDDFMPDFDGVQKQVKPKQTWQEQKQIIEMFNAAYVGEDTRYDGPGKSFGP